MAYLCSKNGGYCSSCIVENCSERKKEQRYNNELKCDGDCYQCDGAVGHISYVAEQVPAREVFVCNLYHVQTHHDVESVCNPNKEMLNKSKIEKINSNLSRCSKCKYSEICISISRNANFTVEDAKRVLGINWNCKNEIILESVPKDQLYAFCMCDELREAIRNLQIRDLQKYMEELK